MKDEVLGAWKELNHIALEIVIELVERYYYYTDDYIDPAELDRVVIEVVDEMNEKYNDSGIYIDTDTYDGVIEIVKDINKGQAFIRVIVNEYEFDKEYGVYLNYSNGNNGSFVELVFDRIDDKIVNIIEEVDRFMNEHIVNNSNLT